MIVYNGTTDHKEKKMDNSRSVEITPKISHQIQMTKMYRYISSEINLKKVSAKQYSRYILSAILATLGIIIMSSTIGF